MEQEIEVDASEIGPHLKVESTIWTELNQQVAEYHEKLNLKEIGEIKFQTTFKRSPIFSANSFQHERVIPSFSNSIVISTITE